MRPKPILKLKPWALWMLLYCLVVADGWKTAGYLTTKSGVPGATGELYTTGLTAVLPSWPGLPCVLLLSCYNYIKQYQQQIDRYPPHSDHCHAHVFFLSFFQVIKNVCLYHKRFEKMYF